MPSDIIEGMQEAHEKLTAKVYVQRDFTGGYDSLGDIVDYTETTERTTVSTTDTRKGFKVTNDTQVDVETPRWDFTLQEGTEPNELLRRLGSKLADISQSSGTDQTTSYDDVVAGKYYFIGANDVTSVVVTIDDGGSPPFDVAVLNTDYTLDAGSGVIYIIPGGQLDGDDIIITYNKPALTFEQYKHSQNPLFQGNVILEEYNQLSEVPLRTLTFQGQIIVTAFPAQTGEFGRWTATVFAMTDPIVVKRQSAN